MNIVGHGIDMVEVGRIRKQLDSHKKHWAGSVFTVDERTQAGLSDNADYFAGRFAAKEAVAKALGTGFSGDVTWHCIEILRLPNGAPTVNLNGGAMRVAKELGVTRWVISITHTSETAIASAIAIADYLATE